MAREKKDPLIRIWTGTPVHGSYDTTEEYDIAEILKLIGYNVSFEGWFSIIEVADGKKALVTHHGRTGYRYPFTPAQTDAEAILRDMQIGKLPQGIKFYVTAHRHTSMGTGDYFGIKVIRCPCWATFIPYAHSTMLMPHILPDIGAYFLIISPEGRIHVQEWHYPPFIYDEAKDEIIEGEAISKSYVNPEKTTIDEPLKTILRRAQKVILILADTHVGERTAVCVPEFTDALGTTYKFQMTKCNERLYKYWKHLALMCRKYFKPDEIWIVGDLVAGHTSKVFEKTRKMTIEDLDRQKQAFIALIRQLIP